MGITLFGRRDLRIWPRAEAVEQEEGVVDEPSLVAGLAPGSVYMGTLAAPEHQAVHAHAPDSLLRGRHSVTLSVRTCLFPYNQSRRMRQMASLAVTFQAVVAEIVASLANEWRLPTLSECQAHV